MSLISTIRAAAGGPKPSRMAEDMPEDEDDMEDEEAEASEDAEETSEAEGEPEDGAASEGDGESASSQARVRTSERRRIKAILSASGADQVPELAAHLAFETDTKASVATGLIEKAVKDARGVGFEKRMAGYQNPKLGTGARSSEPKTADDQLVAFAEARKAKRG